ncbi:hypothetical protein ACPZ19_42300 [Amycolatopsis lurida]
MAAATWYWWLRGLRTDGAALAAKLLDTLGPQPPAGLEEEYVLCAAKAAVSLGPALPAALDRAESIMATIERAMRQPSTMVVWAVVGGPARTRRSVYEKQIGTDPWAHAVAHLGEGFQHQFWTQGAFRTTYGWDTSAVSYNGGKSGEITLTC